MSVTAHQENSPLIGTVFRITVAPGDQVRASQEIIIVESMKMEHPVEAGVDGVVESVLVAEGETIAAGQVLVRITPGAVTASNDSAPVDSTSGERADLVRYRERRYLTRSEEHTSELQSH